MKVVGQLSWYSGRDHQAPPRQMPRALPLDGAVRWHKLSRGTKCGPPFDEHSITANMGYVNLL
jgi:hypothetical protein